MAAKICGEKVYKQPAALKEKFIPSLAKLLSVLRNTTADDKARRNSRGGSTACSSFPIPEEPQDVDQLGDTKILSE